MVPIRPQIQLPPDIPVEIPAGDKATSKVKIHAPKQTNGREVSYTLEDLVKPSDLPASPNFKPGRIVVNIRFSKDGVIHPPVKLNIEITQDDLRRAQGSPFKIAYYDGTTWQIMKDNIPTDTTTVDVEISKVGDPPIGISP